MPLLTGPALQDAIVKVLRGQNVSCAVAFWGAGAVELIGAPEGRTIKLICNLKMGGTNPNVIARLKALRMDVHQIDRLHAKVYIGDDCAIVTSANASINGLGLQGRALAGWVEAGLKIPAQEAQSWFDGLWMQSREILDQDIVEALARFSERAIMTPTLSSFREFQPSHTDFPFIEWVGNANYDYEDDAIQMHIGYVNGTVHQRIDDGFDVECDSDVQVFRRGRWALRWFPRNDGLRNQSTNLTWTCSSGEYVPVAFRYEEAEQQGSVLAMHPLPPVPFNPNLPEFRLKFDEVLAQADFAELRGGNYTPPWFTPARVQRMWQFWTELLG